jgi:4-diphosphocytidyl-2-C-methyl-D-erythritol kinase
MAAGPDAGALGLRLAAQAKVNLALSVAGRRADGYHELRSVFLRLELADTLTLDGDGGHAAALDELLIEGDPDCPVADNLVMGAVDGFRLLARGVGVPVPPMRLRLTKRIPMAAGLAGGSSDAAAALRLMAARHPGAATPDDIRLLAARIGADVPFFLDGASAALVTGVGDVVEPLPPPIDAVGILLITPPEGSSTPAVFRAWDESAAATAGSRAAGEAVDLLAHLLRIGVDAFTLAAHAVALRAANDLWQPATMVTPGLGPLRDRIERLIERPILLTGSGSTLFGLYPSPTAAEQAARELRADTGLPPVRITATSSTGPHIATITSWRVP